jgi:hypothetical protein
MHCILPYKTYIFVQQVNDLINLNKKSLIKNQTVNK